MVRPSAMGRARRSRRHRRRGRKADRRSCGRVLAASCESCRSSAMTSPSSTPPPPPFALSAPPDSTFACFAPTVALPASDSVRYDSPSRSRVVHTGWDTGAEPRRHASPERPRRSCRAACHHGPAQRRAVLTGKSGVGTRPSGGAPAWHDRRPANANPRDRSWRARRDVHPRRW